MGGRELRTHLPRMRELEERDRVGWLEFGGAQEDAAAGKRERQEQRHPTAAVDRRREAVAKEARDALRRARGAVGDGLAAVAADAVSLVHEDDGGVPRDDLQVVDQHEKGAEDAKRADGGDGGEGGEGGKGGGAGT